MAFRIIPKNLPWARKPYIIWPCLPLWPLNWTHLTPRSWPPFPGMFHCVVCATWTLTSTFYKIWGMVFEYSSKRCLKLVGSFIVIHASAPGPSSLPLKCTLHASAPGSSSLPLKCTLYFFFGVYISAAWRIKRTRKKSCRDVTIRSSCLFFSWSKWGKKWRMCPLSWPSLMSLTRNCTEVARSPHTLWMPCSATPPATGSPTQCCWTRGQSAVGPSSRSASPCGLSDPGFKLPVGLSWRGSAFSDSLAS